MASVKAKAIPVPFPPFKVTIILNGSEARRLKSVLNVAEWHNNHFVPDNGQTLWALLEDALKE